MALTGYRRSCGKRSGGIRSIWLAAASSVESAEYDYTTDSYVMVALTGDVEFVRYHFKEDEAAYREDVSYDGSGIVTHTLSFLIERMDSNSTDAVMEFLNASSGGIVAVVETANGVSMLVGYSEKFGTERALKLRSAIGTTGRKLCDVTAESITLESTDTCKSRPFTGSIW